ncbi:hypothetical protein M3Y96_00408600 [Aphelenchoides besseyi]|nr:hypothetical protein M3Y96_00408600 [Aphelenchoides besseyi]
MKTLRKFGFNLAHNNVQEDERKRTRCHPCVPAICILLIVIICATGTWALLFYGGREWYSKCKSENCPDYSNYTASTVPVKRLEGIDNFVAERVDDRIESAKPLKRVKRTERH